MAAVVEIEDKNVIPSNDYGHAGGGDMYGRPRGIYNCTGPVAMGGLVIRRWWAEVAATLRMENILKIQEKIS